MNNQNLSDRDLDVLIALGSAEYVKQLEVVDPEDTDIRITASTRFREKMQKIILKHNKNRYHKLGRLIAAGIVIVFSIGVTSSISVNAFGFRDFFISVYEKYFTLGHVGLSHSSPDVNLPIKNLRTDLYLPGWLPEGYEYQDFYEGNDIYVIQYKSGDNTIRLIQTWQNSTISVDNELIDYQEFRESGRTYYILLNERGDKRSIRLVWMLDQHQLVIESSLDQEIVLKIANNVAFYKN